MILIGGLGGQVTSDHRPGEGAPDERYRPQGGPAPYLVIVLLRVLVELVQGHEGVQGVCVRLKGQGRGCMTHGGRRPCPRGWADTKGPPPTLSQRLDTQRARHRQLPIREGPRQAGLAQSCPQLPMHPRAPRRCLSRSCEHVTCPPQVGPSGRGRRLTLGGGALSLRPPCTPYPGNLCQVCVHVLVADLHHLSDPLVVAAGERELRRVGCTGSRGQWFPEVGPPPDHPQHPGDPLGGR